MNSLDVGVISCNGKILNSIINFGEDRIVSKDNNLKISTSDIDTIVINRRKCCIDLIGKGINYHLIIENIEQFKNLKRYIAVVYKSVYLKIKDTKGRRDPKQESFKKDLIIQISVIVLIVTIFLGGIYILYKNNIKEEREKLLSTKIE